MSAAEDEELPTPSVPPMDMERVDDPDLKRAVIDREPEDVDCPNCGGTIYLVERQTGKRVLAFWDYDLFDSEEYQLEADWPDVQTSEECSTCGWRREL